jgi:aldose 1-epimerase
MKTRLVACFAVLCSITIAAEAKTTVTHQPFGTMPDGTAVEIYTLTDGAYEARIMTYGGIVQSLKVPDRKGHVDDVVLGFDTLDGYVTNNNGPQNAFFGGIIGRYANRIAKGKFSLDGHEYSLPLNNGPNSIHGGPHGFNNVVWRGTPIEDGVELTYVSRDGDSGYPGTLSVTVRYRLSDGALRIEYSATTDKDTILNLTNHSYFNLAGQGHGDVLSNLLTVRASQYTPVDANLIPTDALASVDGTPLDFRKPTPVGTRIDADFEQLRLGHGYDHNWVIDGGGSDLTEAGMVVEPGSGRVMRVLTTQPGVQVYTGNFLDGSIKGKGGVAYGRRTAICLETQHFPDSPNRPKFPSTELKPGETFQSVTVYRFSTQE